MDYSRTLANGGAISAPLIALGQTVQSEPGAPEAGCSLYGVGSTGIYFNNLGEQFNQIKTNRVGIDADGALAGKRKEHW